MDWQEAVALSIVALTLGIMLSRWLRRRRRLRGRLGSCCGEAPSAPGQGSILYQARKGGRPRIVVRPP